MSDTRRRRSRTPSEQREEIQPINREQQRMIAWLKKVRFKKQIFGGISERDVWKKLEELNSMYNLALIAERARYDALLQTQRMHAETGASIDTNANAEEGKAP